MSGRTHTRVELLEALRQQLDVLDDAAALYDAGRRAQALPMAVALRVICHSTTMSTSLLRHLGAEDILLPRIAGAGEPMKQAALRRSSGEISFTLNLDPAGGSEGIDFAQDALVPFAHWWSGEVGFSDHVVALSRRDLVTMLANKDGGAHVQSTVSKELESLREGMGTLTLGEGDASVTTTLSNAHWRTVRMIAQEVRTSGVIAELAGRSAAPSRVR